MARSLLRINSSRSIGKLCDISEVRETFNNHKVRAIVSDDHPLFRDGLVRALTSSGLVDVVAEAQDGPSALEAIKKHQPLPHLRRPSTTSPEAGPVLAPPAVAAQVRQPAQRPPASRYRRPRAQSPNRLRTSRVRAPEPTTKTRHP